MKKLLLLLFLCLTARADVLQINGFVYPINAGPANVSINGGPIRLWECIDASHFISVPSSWDVEFHGLNDLQGVRFFNGQNGFLFWEAAYLFSQALTQPQDQQLAINQAMQRLFNDSSGLVNPGSTYWLIQANGNATGINPFIYVFANPTGDYGQLGIMLVPEPAFYACFAIGLVSLIGFHRLGRKKK